MLISEGSSKLIVMELGWQVTALLMTLSFFLGLCIGKIVTEMKDKTIQRGDRNQRKECLDTPHLNVNDVGMAIPTIPDHLGTEFEGDRDVNRWKTWDADKTETVFLVTKSGTCVHLKDRCPGLNGADPAYPLKKYTLCKHCHKWKVNLENQKHESQRKNK